MKIIKFKVWSPQVLEASLMNYLGRILKTVSLPNEMNTRFIWKCCFLKPILWFADHSGTGHCGKKEGFQTPWNLAFAVRLAGHQVLGLCLLFSRPWSVWSPRLSLHHRFLVCGMVDTSVSSTEGDSAWRLVCAPQAAAATRRYKEPGCLPHVQQIKLFPLIM